MNLDSAIALFADDLEDNLTDQYKCQRVMIYKPPQGRRMRPDDPFWSAGPFAKIKALEAQEGIDIFYRGAGIPVRKLKEFTQAFENGGHPNIRVVFLDFDRTLSSWDDLFGENTAVWIAGWRRSGHWETVRNTLFGSATRCKALVAFLAALGNRATVISNQGDNFAIKTMLEELANDYKHPDLLKIPVLCRAERRNVRKFTAIRRILGATACARKPK